MTLPEPKDSRQRIGKFILELKKLNKKWIYKLYVGNVLLESGTELSWEKDQKLLKNAYKKRYQHAIAIYKKEYDDIAWQEHKRRINNEQYI